LTGFVLNQLPHGLVSDIPGDSRSGATFESVSLGEAWEVNVRDDSTPDEYTGGAHRILWRGSGRGFRINPKAIHPKTCEMCNLEFKGTEGARYCNECRSPKYCKMRRDAKAAEPAEQFEVKAEAMVVTPGKVQDVRNIARNFLRHRKTTEQLRKDLHKAGVDVTETID
jgi:hypothetical protein